MLRICVDLDGTICETKKADQNYEDVLPLPGAVETLQKLKQKGYYIIIHTARNMRTYDGNLGKVIKHQSVTTVNWLEKHNIPYDELLFGKPHVHAFIDDKGIKFSGNWEDVVKQLQNLEEKQ